MNKAEGMAFNCILTHTHKLIVSLSRTVNKMFSINGQL